MFISIISVHTIVKYLSPYYSQLQFNFVDLWTFSTKLCSKFFTYFLKLSSLLHFNWTFILTDFNNFLQILFL